DEADNARAEAHRLIEEHRALIAQARNDAEEILSEARKVAAAQQARAKEETEADRQRRLEETRKQIEAETQKALGQIRAVVTDLTASGNELVRNTLLLLVEKGRIGEVEDVAKEFEALVAKAERRLGLALTTAVELSDEEADRLVTSISGTLGRPIDAQRS